MKNNIRRKKSLKRGRQAVFFTAVDPIDDGYGMGETPCDLAKDRAIQEYLGNVKLAQEKGLQFYQTRSHAVVLYNTLPAACIEKADCVKNSGCALPEGALNSESATSRAKNKLTLWYQKIHKTKTQYHLGNHRAIRKVTVKSVTTPWITE